MASCVWERCLSDILSGFSGSTFETWAKLCYYTQQWVYFYKRTAQMLSFWCDTNRVYVTLCWEKDIQKKKEVLCRGKLHLGLLRHRKFRLRKASAFHQQLCIRLLAMFLLFSVSHWFLWPDPLASHYVTHLPMFITDRRRLMGVLWRSDIISQHRRTPSMAVHSLKCERVNKTGHFSNCFPSVCENYCVTPPQSLSQPVSEHMECVSSVLQMLRWNPPRAGGWIPAKANGFSVALLLLCSDVTSGTPSRDNCCFGEEGKGLSTAFSPSAWEPEERFDSCKSVLQLLLAV